MSGNELRYDALVEDALRGVVREALNYAAERGLPGDHHFYITFRTEHPGVDIPRSLRDRYPNEMTVVLQHQFWGLDVGEEGFGVTLSFADVPERLSIPFAALTAFADPSVQFGLQFDTPGEAGRFLAPTGRAAKPAAGEKAKDVPAGPRPAEPTARKSEAGAGRAAESRPAAPELPGSGPQGEKVVTLDTFRKK